MVGAPDTIGKGLRPYRDLFRRGEGFAHVSRSVAGLIVSPNKTLHSIYAQQVWEEPQPTRRTMHEAGFEAGWEAEELLPGHRPLIAPEHHGRGREVISWDWTWAHQERGPHRYGATKRYDDVEGRMGRFQTVVTAVVANRQLIDGIEVQIQEPSLGKEEETYWKATVQASYAQMEQARTRLLALLHYREPQLADKKRTEIVVEMVARLEEEGKFPQADSAFDNRGLTLELTRLIESKGKPWVSELESSRPILWQEEWPRIDEGAAELRQNHPESFRPVAVRCREGERKEFGAFTKRVRLKRYGRNGSRGCRNAAI